MKKRVLAFLLTIVMVLSLMPTVLADVESEAGLTAQEESSVTDAQQNAAVTEPDADAEPEPAPEASSEAGAAPSDTLMPEAVSDEVETVVLSDTTEGSFTVDANGVLTGYTGTETEVTVPGTVGDVTVQSVAASTFAGNTTITKIVLPDSVTALGEGVFEGCTGLRSFSFYKYVGFSVKNVTSVPKNAFKGCTGLTEVNLSTITEFGENAFEGCTGLTKVTIPALATSLSDGLFKNCTELTNVTFNNGTKLSTYGTGTFEGCAKLTGFTFYNITGVVTALPDNLFKGCLSLTAYEIPSTVTTIGSGTFSGSGIRTITFSDKITSIGAAALSDCPNLRMVNLMGDVSLAGTGLTSAASVRLNRTNTASIAYCTENNISYKLLDQPTGEQVERIYNGVYKADMEKMFAAHDLTYTASVDGGEAEPVENGKFQLQLPGSVSVVEVKFVGTDGKGSTVTKDIQINVIDDGKSTVKTGGVLSKLKDSYGETLTIPAGIVKIEGSAQKDSVLDTGKESIKEIILPEGIEVVGKYAFNDCSHLERVALPDGVTELGSMAFYKCISLKSMVLPSTLKTIGGSAFEGCSAITDINLSSVTNIGGYAFSGCSNLKYVTLSEDLDTIGGRAFMNCTNLTAVVFYGRLKTVPVASNSYGLFQGCSGLKAVYFVDEPGRTETLKVEKNSLSSISNIKEILLPQNATLDSNGIGVDDTKIARHAAESGEVTDTPISAIRLNGDDITGFAPATTAYSIGTQDKKAIVRVVTADGYALSYTVKKDDETIKSSDRCSGAFEFDIKTEGAYVVTVTATHNTEKTSTKSYTVTLNYSSSVPGLKELKVEGGELRTGHNAFSAGDLKPFTSDETGYTVRIHGGTASTNITFKTVKDGTAVYQGKDKTGTEIIPDANGVYTLSNVSTSEPVYITACKTEGDADYSITYTLIWYKTNPAINTIGEVTDYKPAPGGYISSGFVAGKGMFDNILNGYTAWNNYVSVGGFGGYIEIKCSQPIKNSDKNPYGVDFMIYGNAFAYGNGSGGEPSTVLVSKDGKTWYTLAGSAHYETTTNWAVDATLKDGSTTTAVQIARMGDNGVDGSVPANLTVFGYADVHGCSGTENGEGVYAVTGKSDNPYRENHPENIGDSFDISWAVDANGKPVYLDEISYIKIQNAVDINHPNFGDNSTEISAVCEAVGARQTSVGVTSAPASIKINGKEYIGTNLTKVGNTYYAEGNLSFASTVNVQVVAGANDNVYLNNQRYQGTAECSFAIAGDGTRMIRVIVQSGEKEPLIYVFKLTGGDTTDYLLDALSVKTTGAPFEGLSKTDGLTYKLTVTANYDNVDVYPTVETGATVTVDGKELTDGFVNIQLGAPGSTTMVKIVAIKEGRTEETSLVIKRETYQSTEVQTGTAIISVEKFVLGQGYILEPTEVTFNKGDTAADVTKKVLGADGFQAENSQFGFYLSDVADTRGTPEIPAYVLEALEKAGVKIDYTDSDPEWLGEFDYTNTSGWMVTVNNRFIDRSAGKQTLQDGDVIRWQFTVYGLGADLGNSSPDTSHGGQQSLKPLANKDTLTKLMAQYPARITDAVMETATKLDATQDEVNHAVAILRGESASGGSAGATGGSTAQAEVTIEKDANGETVAKVELPKGADSAVASIPTAELGGGNVLVRVNADGSETIIKKSLVDGDTAYALVNGDCTVKLVDNSKTFDDTASHWGKDAIAFASSHELFQGVSETKFAPDMPMSRAMLATVLYRLEDAAAKGSNPFADVPTDTWYTDAVTWANGAGIVQGTGKGFEPNGNITREQLATMLYRYAKTLGMDTAASGDLSKFTDGAKTSAWAADAMKWAIGSGLISGKGNGVVDPTGNATRAEVAAIFQRMVKLMVK